MNLRAGNARNVEGERAFLDLVRVVNHARERTPVEVGERVAVGQHIRARSGAQEHTSTLAGATTLALLRRKGANEGRRKRGENGRLAHGVLFLSSFGCFVFLVFFVTVVGDKGDSSRFL